MSEVCQSHVRMNGLGQDPSNVASSTNWSSEYLDHQEVKLDHGGMLCK